MVEIDGMPILWHIMKIYSSHGIHDFVICCGYKAYVIKEYFSNYFLHTSDVTYDIQNNEMTIHKSRAEPWRVTLVDTGEGTLTGGRLKRITDYIGSDTFCMTYGDGVSDVNISKLVAFHKKQNTLATMTAVQPPGRFGAFKLGHNQDVVNTFKEKPDGDGAWVNGGFFVLEPQVLDYIEDDQTVWEKEPLEKLAQAGALSAFKHVGFWQPMDTLRDKHVLEDLWRDDKAPWKTW